MFTKKQIYILIILFLVLAGSIFVFHKKYDKWPWQRNVVLPSPKNSDSEISLTPPTPSAIFSQTAKGLRELIMEDVAKRINEISSVKPVLGGKWYVLRFWFVNDLDNTFYVECEEGHIMRKFLITADISEAPNEFSYQVDAIFDAGESDWFLISGEDRLSGLPLILYEYDENLGRWIKKN